MAHAGKALPRSGSDDTSDEFPQSRPNANNIPAGYAKVGSFYNQFKAEAQQRWGVQWPTGGAIFVYPNDQPAGTLWYHDHSLGVTRLDVHSGLVAYYLLRGGPRDLPAGVLPGPAPQVGDSPGTKYREIALVFQDKTFNTDGSVNYPASRLEAGDTQGPFIPQTDVPPYWTPVVTRNTILVNGNTWPFLNVEPRRYRFRFLGAANIRPWQFKVVSDPLNPSAAAVRLIWVIGSDGGYLPTPQQVEVLPVFTSERYDVIVDFTGLTPGSQVFLANVSPDADPNTTGQVMRFNIVPLTSTDTSTPPSQLHLPGFVVPPASTVTRKLTAQQLTSAFLPGVTSRFSLGTLNADGTSRLRRWFDPLTETPRFNTTETWEVHNFTQGGHAIHIHLIQFAVVNRQLTGGPIQPPAPHETGPKDVIFTPGIPSAGSPPMITRIRMTFDRRSRYIWHCHFLEHEDHEMMRPFVVS